MMFFFVFLAVFAIMLMALFLVEYSTYRDLIQEAKFIKKNLKDFSVHSGTASARLFHEDRSIDIFFLKDEEPIFFFYNKKECLDALPMEAIYKSSFLLRVSYEKLIKNLKSDIVNCIDKPRSTTPP